MIKGKKIPCIFCKMYKNLCKCLSSKDKKKILSNFTNIMLKDNDYIKKVYNPIRSLSYMNNEEIKEIIDIFPDYIEYNLNNYYYKKFENIKIGKILIENKYIIYTKNYNKIKKSKIYYIYGLSINYIDFYIKINNINNIINIIKK